jgi:phospholipid transport system substrate-binding protein
MEALAGRRSLLQAATCSLLAPSLALAQGQDASAPIRQLYNALLTVMKEGRNTPFMQRSDVVGPAVDRAFDLPYVLQTAVGFAWASIPPQQQAKLEVAFRNYTVATYVSEFDSYSGQRFQIFPGTRAVGNGQQVLHTEIVPTSGDPHILDYVMRAKGGTWKAVDVLLDGSISRVAVLRSDFRSLLSSGGPSGLASDLQRKATDLSSGSMPT